MNGYRAVFEKQKNLIVVIHIESEEQALRNARIAKNAGASGIFLINHRSSADSLLRIYGYVKMYCGNLWIGLNCLDLSPKEAVMQTPKDIAGLWIDDGGIKEDSDDPAGEARELAELRARHGTRGLYFGGVAFKYQGECRDPARAARLAMPYMDVVTTSGEKTGSPPAIEKVRLMKRAIGDHPLAIASGITAQNVREYIEYADYFLVATGVSDSDTELNAGKVEELARIISA